MVRALNTNLERGLNRCVAEDELMFILDIRYFKKSTKLIWIVVKLPASDTGVWCPQKCHNQNHQYQYKVQEVQVFKTNESLFYKR